MGKIKVLVIGGSGFLGKYVADELSRRGYKVVIFDMKVSPYLKSDQKMVIGNILDINSVSNVVSESDVVYHFAAIADIKEATKNPVKTVAVNILGTTNVLSMCQQFNVKRFIFASSVYIHNDTFGSFYRTTKRTCEQLIKDYNEVYDLPFTILRYGSLYGLHAPRWNGLQRIINQAKSNKIIKVAVSSDTEREYIHVKDAAEMSALILNKEYKNQCVTLTGRDKISHSKLIKIIKEISGRNFSVEFNDSDSQERYKLTPYNIRLRESKKLVNNYYRSLEQFIYTELLK